MDEGDETKENEEDEEEEEKEKEDDEETEEDDKEETDKDIEDLQEEEEMKDISEEIKGKEGTKNKEESLRVSLEPTDREAAASLTALSTSLYFRTRKITTIRQGKPQTPTKTPILIEDSPK